MDELLDLPPTSTGEPGYSTVSKCISLIFINKIFECPGMFQLKNAVLRHYFYCMKFMIDIVLYGFRGWWEDSWYNCFFHHFLPSDSISRVAGSVAVFSAGNAQPVPMWHFHQQHPTSNTSTQPVLVGGKIYSLSHYFHQQGSPTTSNSAAMPCFALSCQVAQAMEHSPWASLGVAVDDRGAQLERVHHEGGTGELARTRVNHMSESQGWIS